MKRLSPKQRALAEKRAADLWAYYNEHGRLTLTDFKRITGGQFAGVSETLKTYGLTAPPVWDSREERYKRKAKALWGKAKELDRAYLSTNEAAQVLGLRPCEVSVMEAKLKGAGLELPVIVGKDQDMETYRGRLEKNMGDEGTRPPREAQSYYPRGLQVLRCWPGPEEGQITYLLK